MVGIISGNTLGLVNSSIDKLGNPLGQPTDIGQAKGSAYVNIATGNLSVQFVDEALSGTGADLFALRTYNSLGTATDGDADAWRWNGEKRVSLSLGTLNSANSELTQTRGDGSLITYRWNGTTYVSTSGSGAHDTLSWDAINNEWQFKQGGTNYDTESYDGTTGWIKRYRDESGNGFDYLFSNGKLASITDIQSRQRFDFVYGTDGKLAELRTFSAASAIDPGVLRKQTSYTYYAVGTNGAGRLASVTTDLTPENTADNITYTTSYVYDAQSRLIQVQQSDGTSASFSYDAQGRIFSVTDKTGVTSFTYNTVNPGQTDVTLGDGSIWNYSYDTTTGPNAKQLLKAQSPLVNGVRQSAQYTYDAQGNIATKTDGLGNITSYTYDVNGNQIKAVDSLGNTITRTYGATNLLLSSTHYAIASTAAPSGAETTRYVYDAVGRLRFVITPQGRVSESRYSSQGLITQQLSYVGATYAGVGSAETDLQTWAGGLTAIQLSQTERTDYTYDYRGNLSRQTDYATVNSSGVGVLDNAADITEYVYSEYGQLLQKVVARGTDRATKNVQVSYLYDGLGRQISEVSAAGTVTTTYANAAITVSQLATGLSIISNFDTQGRIISSTQNASGINRLTQYYYNSASQLRVTKDAAGLSTYFFYDFAGRLNAKVNSAGSATIYSYDANGNTTNETQLATAIPLATLSAWGTTPPTSLTYTLSPSSDRVTTYAYDLAGRLTGTTVSGEATITRVYDGASRLAQIIQGDRVTRFFYDKDGLQIGLLDAEQYLSETQYDNAGRVIKTIRYGQKVATVSDFASMKTAVAAGEKLTAFIYYDSEGRAIGSVNEQGFLTETIYDAANNRRQVVQYTNAVIASDTDPLSMLKLQSGPSTNTTTIQFDVYGRVDKVTTQDGGISHSYYDTAGRLIRQVQAEGTTDERAQRIRYNAAGDVIGTVSGVGEALYSQANTGAVNDTALATYISNYGTRFDIDGAGRKIAEYQPNGQKTLLYYDAAGNLTYTINALGEVLEFTYNVFGLIEKTRTYTGRISTTGLTGGLVTASLTTLINGIANTATDKIITTVYNQAGRVGGVFDAEGTQTAYIYNSFGEQVGQRQWIGTFQSVLTEQVRDKLGRVTANKSDTDTGGLAITNSQISYDGFGRIKTMTDARGNLSQYQYDNNGRSIIITDPLGRLTRTDIDFTGRTIAFTDAMVNYTRYTYDDTNRKIVVTGPDGAKVTTTKTRTGETLSVVDAKGATTTYTYDKNGQIKTITNALGQIVNDNTYDNSGRVYESKDGNGVVTRYTYDAANRIVQTAVDPTGINLRTSYVFDGQGRQLRVIQGDGTPDASTTDYTYNRNGQVTQIVNDPLGLKLSTRFTYNGLGLITKQEKGTVSNPSQQTTTYTFDTLGRKTAETQDPAGLNITTRYQYDNNNNLIQKTDARGNITRYAYDANDNLRFVVNADGSVNETVYDGNGNAIKVTQFASPIGALANYSEATINTAVNRTNAANRSSYYTYEQNNRLHFTVEADGSVTENNYDANGNLIQTTEFATVPALAGIYSDANINSKVVRTDSNNRTTRYVYDAVNRLNFTINAEGAASESIYDANNNLVRSTLFAAVPALTTDFSLAAVSAAVNRTDVANRVVNYTYDKANRLRFTVNAEGAVNENSYDAKNNLIKVTHFATKITAPANYAESTLNGLVNRTDVNNQTSNYVYDAVNRVRYSIDAENALTENTYDAYGNIVSTIHYDARITTQTNYTEASVNAVVNRADSNNQITNFAYDKLNRLHFTVNAEGAVTEHIYDTNGNVIQNTEFATKPTFAGDYSESAINALVNRTNTANRTTYFAFDSLNRLHFSINAEGGASENVYGAFGDLIATTTFASMPNLLGNYSEANINTSVNRADTKNRTTRFTYDAMSRVHFKVDAEGAVSETTYDVFGQTLSFTGFATLPAFAGDYSDATINTLVNRTDTNNRKNYFTYDRLGRTHFTVNAAGAVTENNYDTKGNLIKLTAFATVPTLTSYTDTAINAAVLRTDTNNRVTLYAYDRNNRVRFVVDAENYLSETTYDAFGNVKTLTQFASRLATLTSYTETTINAAANRTNTSNRTTAYDYDRLNHQIRTTLTGWYDVGDGIVYAAQEAQADRFQRTIEVTYDAFGNAVANKMRTGLSSYAIQYMTYDKQNRVVNSIDALGYVTQNKYNAFGDIITITQSASSLGVRTSGYWRNSEIAAQSGRTITTDYDRLGRKIKVTQPTTSNLYRSQDYSVTTSGGGTYYTQGSSINYIYDAFGNLVKQQATWDNLTTADTYFYYNRLGQQTLVVNAENYGTTTEYNAFGNTTRTIEYATKATSAPAIGLPPTFAANTKDRETAMIYDALSHVKSSNRRINGTLTQVNINTFNAFGELVSSEDALKNITRVEYNHIGQKTKIIDAARTVAGTGVDLFIGQRKLSPTVANTYDAFGQTVDETTMEDVTSTSGRKISYQYDATGNRIKITDALSAVTDFQFDVSGNIITEKQNVSAAAGAASYAYTIERRFEYDANGRQTASVDILGNQKSGQVNTYNGYGEVISERKIWGLATDTTSYLLSYAPGNAIINTYAYDGAGRMQWKRSANGYTYFFYDLMNNVTRSEQRGTDSTNVTTAKVTENYYDKLGRTVFERYPQFSTTTSFGSSLTTLSTPYTRTVVDRWGNVLSRSGSAPSVSYQYNQDNQVTVEQTANQDMMKVDGTTQTVYHIKTNQYNAIGNLTLAADTAYVYGTNLVLGAQNTMNYYNEAGQLKQVITAYGSSLSASTSYAYDSFGNKVATRDAIGHVTVDDFDANNQLIRHSIIRNSLLNEDYIGQTGAGPTKVYLTENKYDQVGRKYANGSYASNTRVAYAYYQFDERSNIVKSINEANVVKEYKFDIVNNKIEEKTVSTPGVFINQHNWNFNNTYVYGGTTVNDYVDYQINLANSHTVAGATYTYTYNNWGQIQSETSGVTLSTSTYGNSSERSIKTYSYWENGLEKSIRDEDILDVSWTTTNYNYRKITAGQTDYFYDKRGNRTTDHNLSTMTQKNAATKADLDNGIFNSTTTTTYDDTTSYTGYDSANRLNQFKSAASVTTIDLNNYTTANVSLLSYDYDEWSNRRRIQSNYTLSGGTATTKAEWYNYDAANRVTVDAGVVENGIIVASKNGGTSIAYDKLNRRVIEEIWLDQVSGGAAYGVPTYEKYEYKTYSYNDLSLVNSTNTKESHRIENGNTSTAPTEIIDNGWVESSEYDLRGFKISSRVSSYSGSSRSSNYLYRDDGSLLTQSTYVSSTLESQTLNSYNDAGELLNSNTDVYDVSKSILSYSEGYAYNYAEYYSGRQGSLTQLTTSFGTTGKTSNTYDWRGRLSQVVIDERNQQDATDIVKATRKYIYNQSNQIVIRAEDHGVGYKLQKYYYTANSAEIADLGALSGINISPLNVVAEGTDTPSSYTVMPGDTLSSISKSLFGDSQYWYLIADANGLTLGPQDPFSQADIGRKLRIPNTSKEIGNSASTFKPYNASEAIGKLNPDAFLGEAPEYIYQTLPTPHNNKACRIVAIIAIVAIAIVVSIVTAGAAAVLLGGVAAGTGIFAAGVAVTTGAALAGATAAQTAIILGAAALGGFAGSLASQGTSKAFGMTEKVSIKQALAAGITAGLSAGAGAAISHIGEVAGASKYAIGAVKGLANYSIGFVANDVVGLHTKPNWSDLATSVFAGSLAEGANNYNMGNSIAASVATDLINSTVTFGFSRLVHGKDQEELSWTSAEYAAADAFGNALGNGFVKGMINISANRKAKQTAAANAAGSKAANSDINAALMQPMVTKDEVNSTSIKVQQVTDDTTTPSESMFLTPKLDEYLATEGMNRPSTSSGSESSNIAPPEPEKYIVKNGDYYEKIARKMLGNDAKYSEVVEYSKKLVATNKRTMLHPGDQLILPDSNTKLTAEDQRAYNQMYASYLEKRRVAEAMRIARENAAAAALQKEWDKQELQDLLSNNRVPSEMEEHFQRIRLDDQIYNFKNSNNGEYVPPNESDLRGDVPDEQRDANGKRKWRQMGAIEDDNTEIKVLDIRWSPLTKGKQLFKETLYQNKDSTFWIGREGFMQSVVKSEVVYNPLGNKSFWKQEIAFKNEGLTEIGIKWAQGRINFLGKDLTYNLRSGAELYTTVDLVFSLKEKSFGGNFKFGGQAAALIIQAQRNIYSDTLLGIIVNVNAEAEAHFWGAGASVEYKTLYEKGKFSSALGLGVTAKHGGKVKIATNVDFSGYTGPLDPFNLGDNLAGDSNSDFDVEPLVKTYKIVKKSVGDAYKNRPDNSDSFIF